jgi:hypothetical protein
MGDLSLQLGVNTSNPLGGASGTDASLLRFHGATSELGGSEYQIGQLIHDVTIDASGNAKIEVSKTNPSTDVDVSNFDNAGTVSSRTDAVFELRGIGNRNGVNSAIRGATTEDSIGVLGDGNPSKIDVYEGNSTEFITWQISNLPAGLTFNLKSISIIRANFISGNKPSMVLTDFASGTGNYTPDLQGANIVTFDDFGSQTVTLAGTGAGVNGSFLTGITGVNGVGYGIYAIDFDITE